jgi:hypothetical protein
MTSNIRLDEGKIQRSGFSEGPKIEKPKIIPKGQSTIKNETMKKSSFLLKSITKEQCKLMKQVGMVLLALTVVMNYLILTEYYFLHLHNT